MINKFVVVPVSEMGDIGRRIRFGESCGHGEFEMSIRDPSGDME